MTRNHSAINWTSFDDNFLVSNDDEVASKMSNDHFLHHESLKNLFQKRSGSMRGNSHLLEHHQKFRNKDVDGKFEEGWMKTNNPQGHHLNP